MGEENISGSELGGESQLNPSPSETPVGNVSANLTLEELNTVLGKQFPSKEAALKSVKDTFSYVGKKKEDIAREVTAEIKQNDKTEVLANELAEMRKERFYDRNPQYADPAIRSFIEATGKNPVEVVETPAFKEIFTKIAGYDETQKLKTVLETNPRLTSSRDSLAKAKEIVDAHKGIPLQGQYADEVESLAVNAVLDAYPDK